MQYWGMTLSNYEYFYSSLDGMLVRYVATPSIKFPAPFIPLSEERNCKSKVCCPRTQRNAPGLKPGPFNPESSGLTIRPLHLPPCLEQPIFNFISVISGQDANTTRNFVLDHTLPHTCNCHKRILLRPNTAVNNKLSIENHLIYHDGREHMTSRYVELICTVD